MGQNSSSPGLSNISHADHHVDDGNMGTWSLVSNTNHRTLVADHLHSSTKCWPMPLKLFGVIHSLRDVGNCQPDGGGHSNGLP